MAFEAANYEAEDVLHGGGSRRSLSTRTRRGLQV